MAVVVPALDQLHRLPTPLNEGEQEVLEALCQLDYEWHVYIEPRLLMDKPDFVAVHPRFGVCAVEVKDWAVGLYRQDPDTGVIEVWEADGWQRTRQAPRYQAHRYRQTIFERFFAQPETRSDDFAVVRAVVVLPRYSTVAANTLLHTHTVLDNAEGRIRVFGGDSLRDELTYIVTGYRNPYGMNIPPHSMGRLHAQLAEPEAIADQREPLSLSRDAKNIATNPNNARIRRARGPAGSGKSLGLAARAARLAIQGQDVLALGFNITLPHYLHDLAARHGRELGASIRRIEFTHFHAFCNQVRKEHAIGVGRGRTLDPASDQEVERGRGAEWIVDAALAAYREGYDRIYDSILVDEGQDFTTKWWNLLREHAWNAAGEMLLVSDTAQDLYDRAWLHEPEMPNCGFRGWTDLKGCYRLPPDLVPILSEFAGTYLEGAGAASLLTVPSDRDACEPTIRRWINVVPGDAGRTIAAEVQRILDEGVAPSDIVYLCESHQIGLETARLLDQAGVYVTHVFTEEDDDERRDRKKRFWGGTDGVKGCTVHSFKGWEARAVVLAPTASQNAHLLTYIALTRVKGDPGHRSAVITVANSDPTLADFAASFIREIRPDEAPALGGQRRMLLDEGHEGREDIPF